MKSKRRQELDDLINAGLWQQSRLLRSTWLDEPWVSPALRAYASLTGTSPAWTLHDAGFYDDDSSDPDTATDVTESGITLSRGTGTANRWLVRIAFNESNNKNPLASTFSLEYNYNSTGWTVPTTGTTYVRVTTATYTNQTATDTRLLGDPTGGQWANGQAMSNTGASGSLDYAAYDETELVWCVYFVDADVTNGHTCTFRVTDTTGYSWTYSVTPTVTVVKLPTGEVTEDASARIKLPSEVADTTSARIKLLDETTSTASVQTALQGETTATASVRIKGPAFTLSLSDYISTSGENTTGQLNPPSGKTESGDFTAGRIQDDENPCDSIDVGSGGYTEIEWCIIATDDADLASTYEFRVTRNGTVFDTYNTTPEWTIGSAATDAEVTSPASARILVSHEATDTVSARIALQSEVTEAVSVRVALPSEATEPGSARIKLLSESTGDITARIALQSESTESASARVGLQSEATSPASARLALQGENTGPGSVRLKLPDEITDTSTARIKLLAEETNVGTAQIALPGQVNYPGSARLQVASEVTEDASARISAAAMQAEVTEDTSVRIKVLTEVTDSASARLLLLSEVTESASVRTALQSEVTDSASIRTALQSEATEDVSARIALQNEATQDASIRTALQSEVTAAASVQVEIPATLEQEGYRWRDDDGSESAATWLQPQDANIWRGKNTNTRIRIIINASENPDSEQFQLEVRKQGVGTWQKIE